MSVYASKEIRYSNGQATVVILFVNHCWCKARCCSSRTPRQTALPVARRLGGMKQYIMTNTSAAASIFGMKHPKVKDRKEITHEERKTKKMQQLDVYY